ncbi:MAG TPA: metal ABC transporter ATP-binding protein [Terrimicrobiaceae bacterium]
MIIQDLTVSYHRIPAVHHLSVQLQSGSCIGLVGPNGAGKTTLLKALASLLPLETGRIRFKGREIAGGRLITYVPQREAVDWDFPITVRGLAEMGRYSVLGAWKPFGVRDDAMVEEAIRVAELEAFADRQIKALSGGQQQRAFLARAWAQEAEIYLLDEPFGGLDKNASAAFAKAMHRLRDSKKLVIASHHNLADAAELFDQILILNGELVAFGDAAETLTKANIDRAFSTRIFSGHKK